MSDGWLAGAVAKVKPDALLNGGRMVPDGLLLVKQGLSDKNGGAVQVAWRMWDPMNPFHFRVFRRQPA